MSLWLESLVQGTESSPSLCDSEAAGSFGEKLTVLSRELLREVPPLLDGYGLQEPLVQGGDQL